MMCDSHWAPEIIPQPIQSNNQARAGHQRYRRSKTQCPAESVVWEDRNETKMLGGEPAGREEGSLMPSGPAKWAPSLGTARWPPEPSGCPGAFQHQLIGLGADPLSHLRIWNPEKGKQKLRAAHWSRVPPTKPLRLIWVQPPQRPSGPSVSGLFKVLYNDKTKSAVNTLNLCSAEGEKPLPVVALPSPWMLQPRN